MPASISTNTVRDGVKLLAGLMAEADNQAVRPNGRVSKADVASLTDAYGDGGVFDKAMEDVHRYARRKYSTSAPTIAQVKSALGDAMKGIGRAAKDDGDNKVLSSSEQVELAKTWKSVVAFAREYEGLTVADLTQPSE